VVFLAQHCAQVGDGWGIILFKIAANCLSYMNSCVNPILYAFLSEPFRKNMRRLLLCRQCGSLFQRSGAGTVMSPATAGRACRIALVTMDNARQQPTAATPAVKHQPDEDADDFEDKHAA